MICCFMTPPIIYFCSVQSYSVIFYRSCVFSLLIWAVSHLREHSSTLLNPSPASFWRILTYTMRSIWAWSMLVKVKDSYQCFMVSCRTLCIHLSTWPKTGASCWKSPVAMRFMTTSLVSPRLCSTCAFVQCYADPDAVRYADTNTNTDTDIRTGAINTDSFLCSCNIYFLAASILISCQRRSAVVLQPPYIQQHAVSSYKIYVYVYDYIYIYIYIHIYSHTQSYFSTWFQELWKTLWYS